ncbi:contractile injection system tape measure protein [Roseateles depolymerans]|uniref:Uncharacterized protein n=1 Tax=Roseateles depolymerans TaxID=76731 RepID=A0A0U3D0F1_9BURK|nr:contractile injection system tape measure protein [Roseateles depolymerans]ALV07062.1 hypothetical protein RD2015_2597 [Roseateles depolymerans]REG20045.1 hypothetical protein DES44_2551 [Roseateles depolymerans]
MRDPHLIEHLHADAEIHGVNAEEAETRWTQWLQTTGLRLLDDVLEDGFRTTCDPDDVWTLPTLTLDLGPVDTPDWEEAWARQLPIVARRALEDCRGPGGARHRPAGVRSRPQSRLALLLHFLRTGRWPWQARGEDPRLLAQELLQRDPAALVAALRQQDDRALLVRRLVLQFDRHWLAALVQALLPGRLAQAQRLLGLVAPHGLQGQAPADLLPLWEVVLDEALAADASSSNSLARARSQLKVALALGRDVAARQDPLLALGEVWTQLMREDAAWLRETLQDAARQDGMRQRFTRALPAALLPDLLTLWMDTALHQEVQRWIETVLTTAPSTSAETQERRVLLWQATLDHALRGQTGSFEPQRYTDQVRLHLAERAADGPQAPKRWFDKVVDSATSLLSRAARALGLRWRGRSAEAPASASLPSPLSGGTPEDSATPLQVGNAGLVLLHPYLPHLFQRLGLCDGPRFKDEAAAQRAALLLEAVVMETADDGAAEPLHLDAVESALGLNKLICGLPMHQPLPREWTLSPEERQVIHGLLTAVIQHWRVLGSTQVNGLRQTFLRRSGLLSRDQDGWRLKVNPGPFDMLIDHLPWGYSVLKFGWMEGVLHVDWR